ncbi:hypothetical protein DL96DRAFT_1625061 [Flagelloscypha sp. PMI_526]|nr:hypothetical protein DL96DRAFT_1625061 [Flagelloscypha sp. PMI_526]
MELMAGAPSVFNLVQFVDAALHVALTLKGMVDKVKENNDLHTELMRNILRHLKELKRVGRRADSVYMTTPEHRRAFELLKSDLDKALALCEKSSPQRKSKIMRLIGSGQLHSTLVAVDERIRRCLELFNTGAIMRVEENLAAFSQALTDQTVDMKTQMVSVTQDLDHVRRSLNRILDHHNLDVSDTKSLLDNRTDNETFRTARSRSKKTLQSVSETLVQSHYPPPSLSGSTLASVSSAFSSLRSDSGKDAILSVIDSLRILQRQRYQPSAHELDHLAVALFTIGQAEQAKDLSLQAAAHLCKRDTYECRARVYLNLSSHLLAVEAPYTDVLKAIERSVSYYRRARVKDGLATSLDHLSAILLAYKSSSLSGIEASNESVALRRETCDSRDSMESSTAYALVLSRHAHRLYAAAQHHPHHFSSEALRSSTESVALYQDILKRSPSRSARLRLQGLYGACLRIHALCLADCRKLTAAITAGWEAVEIFSAQNRMDDQGVAALLSSIEAVVTLIGTTKDDLYAAAQTMDLRQIVAQMRELPWDDAIDLANAAQVAGDALHSHCCPSGARTMYDLAYDVYRALDRMNFTASSVEQAACIQMGQARALQGMADCLVESERTSKVERALDFSQQACDILWALPGLPTRDQVLADTLVTMARCHRFFDDELACISAYETSANLLTTIGSENENQRTKLASIHHNLATLLTPADKLLAVHHFEEAYNLYRQLPSTAPGQYIIVGVAYSVLLSEVGRHEEALVIAQQVNGVSVLSSGFRLKRRATQRLRTCQQQTRRSMLLGTQHGRRHSVLF